jgi:ribonuclease T2
VAVKRPAALALAAAVLLHQAQAQTAPDAAAAAKGFDFYVLALTWSPGFCKLEGRRKERAQCEPGRALGFTVHGLWPQVQRGFITECGPAGRSPSRAALAEAKGVFPDEGLARYQWRRHGTCSGKSPAEYFREVRRAREQVRIPASLQSLAGEALSMSPIDIERTFAEANPGLRPDMMSVVCRRGTLQEVRICFEPDLRGFRHCPDVDRSGCRGGTITIDAPR